MGIITGYICLLCVILLLVKYIARKFHFNTLNKGLMKIHKYVACAFLLVGMIHFVLVLPVIDTREITVTISGIVAIIAAVSLTVVCHLIKDRKKEIIFHRGFSLIITIMVLIHIVSYFYDFNSYKTAISQISIDEIDLDCVEDGAYIGECDTGYIYAKVKVVVKEHSIKEIELLEHNHERGDAAEKIVDTIVSKQKIDVDTVSGATNSSLVIKKACADALTRK